MRYLLSKQGGNCSPSKSHEKGVAGSIFFLDPIEGGLLSIGNVFHSLNSVSCLNKLSRVISTWILKKLSNVS